MTAVAVTGYQWLAFLHVVAAMAWVGGIAMLTALSTLVLLVVTTWDMVVKPGSER